MQTESGINMESSGKWRLDGQTKTANGTIWTHQVPGKGWIQDNGSWYCSDTNGVMQTGWTEDNLYYLGSDGAMKTGWRYLEPLMTRMRTIIPTVRRATTASTGIILLPAERSTAPPPETRRASTGSAGSTENITALIPPERCRPAGCIWMEIRILPAPIPLSTGGISRSLRLKMPK